ncbi:hypothetical protein GCM10027062_39150 [Nocardioides hungaricus]
MTGRARGDLQADVMGVLWASDSPLTARQVIERIAGDAPAQTTMLTVLDRLVHKGLVRRVGDGPRGVAFAATSSETEHVSQTMLDALTGSTDRAAALLRFMGDLEATDAELVERAISSVRGRRGGPA